MGHELTVEGLRPSKQKVEAIENMSAAEDKAGLQRLLEMTNYLARYCPHFSETTAVLRELLNNGNEFRWDDRHQMAFNKLKEMLHGRCYTILTRQNPWRFKLTRANLD